MITIFLAVSAVATLSFLGIIVAYQYFLLSISICTKKKYLYDSERRTQFVVLIPAHNEELVIKRTLLSISKIRYPSSRFKVVVIADNCSDQTARIAKEIGFECFERRDEMKRGKAYAIQWGLERVSHERFDAVVVIDADTIVSDNLLEVYDKYLRNGFKAVQVANLVDKNQKGVYPCVSALGSLVKNYFVYLPKSLMGLSAFLLGTGMCLHREVLRVCFSESCSISEDIECSLRLIQCGHKIAFTTEANVETIFPVDSAGTFTQRVRWSSGTFSLIRKYLPTLLIKGLKERDIVLIDTALSLFSWSKGLLAFLFFYCVLTASFAGKWALFAICFLLLLEVAYHCSGALLLYKQGYHCKSLLLAPFVVPWFLLITILGIVGYRKAEWRRTKRK